MGDLPKLMLQEDAGRAPGRSAARVRGGGEDQRREGNALSCIRGGSLKSSLPSISIRLLEPLHKVVGHVHSQ